MRHLHVLVAELRGSARVVMRHSEGDPIMTQGEGQDVSDRYQAGGGPALRDCEHPAYAMLAVRDDEYDRLDAGPANQGTRYRRDVCGVAQVKTDGRSGAAVR